DVAAGLAAERTRRHLAAAESPAPPAAAPAATRSAARVVLGAPAHRGRAVVAVLPAFGPGVLTKSGPLGSRWSAMRSDKRIGPSKAGLHSFRTQILLASRLLSRPPRRSFFAGPFPGRFSRRRERFTRQVKAGTRRSCPGWFRWHGGSRKL